MKIKNWIGVGALVLLLVFVGWMLYRWYQQNNAIESLQITNSYAESAQVVTSDDGLATLTIPEGALPTTVSVDDIALTKQDAGTDLAVYDMSPSGLQFILPARLEIQLPSMPEEIPLLAVESEGGAELVDDAVVEIDLEHKVTKIFGDIQHFSQAYALMGWHEVILSDSEDHAAGETWSEELKVKNIRDEIIRHEDEPNEVAFIWVYPWSVQGKLTTFSALGAPVEPKSDETFPAPSRVKDGVLVENIELTCKEEGIFNLKSETTITGSYNRIYLNEKVNIPYTSTVKLNNDIQVCYGDSSEKIDIEDGVVNGNVNSSENTNETSDDNVNSAEEVLVGVLALKGGLYPEQQFHMADPDACGEQHYHASGTVYTIDLTNPATDPAPTGCGFGKVSEVSGYTITVTKSEWEAFLAGAQ